MNIAWMAVALEDPNPVHLDDALAARAGFPSVIAHGTFAVGAIGLLLGRWAGQRYIRQMETRLMAPAFPGDQLVAEGEVERASATQAEVRVRVRAGERLVATCSAEVVWPSGEGKAPWEQSESSSEAGSA